MDKTSTFFIPLGHILHPFTHTCTCRSTTVVDLDLGKRNVPLDLVEVDLLLAYAKSQSPAQSSRHLQALSGPEGMISDATNKFLRKI